MSTIIVTNIDETKPTNVNAYTADVRDNFAEIKTQFLAAAADIDALISGKSDTSHLHTGVYAPLSHTHLLADITDSGGMAAINDAPSDGSEYVRKNAAWAVATGGGGTPGGPNTSIQYNDGGSFGGSGSFILNGTTIESGFDMNFYQGKKSIYGTTTYKTEIYNSNVDNRSYYNVHSDYAYYNVYGNGAEGGHRFYAADSLSADHLVAEFGGTNGGVKLYHDSNKRLEATALGVDILNTLKVDTVNAYTAASPISFHASPADLPNEYGFLFKNDTNLTSGWIARFQESTGINILSIGATISKPQLLLHDEAYFHKTSSNKAYEFSSGTNKFTVIPIVGSFSADNSFGYMWFLNQTSGRTYKFDNNFSAYITTGSIPIDLGTVLEPWDTAYVTTIQASNLYGLGGELLLNAIPTSTGSAEAFQLNSTIGLTTVGDKLVSVKNAGVEKAFIDKDGSIDCDRLGIGTLGIDEKRVINGSANHVASGAGSFSTYGLFVQNNVSGVHTAAVISVGGYYYAADGTSGLHTGDSRIIGTQTYAVKTGTATGFDDVVALEANTFVFNSAGADRHIGILINASMFGAALQYSAGIDIGNFGYTGVPVNYGIKITKQTGATENHGISLLDDGVGADICFGLGRDDKIYHDGTNLVLDAANAIDAEGVLLQNGQGAFGTKIIAATVGINAGDTFAATGSTPYYGISAEYILSGSPVNADDITGVFGRAEYTQTPSGTEDAVVIGGRFEGRMNSAGNASTLVGLWCEVSVQSTGEPANAYAVNAIKDYSSGTPTTLSVGVNVNDMGAAGTTIATGLRIVAQTNSTINRGIHMVGSGLGSDICFGISNLSRLYKDTGDEFTFSSGETDAATAEAFVFNSANALSTDGAKLLTISNNAVEKTSVDKDGVIECEYPISRNGFIHIQPTTVQNVGGANGTIVFINWNTTPLNYDTAVFTHSTSTNPSRITVDKTGRYHIKASISFDNTGGARCTLGTQLRVNGTTTINRGKHRNYTRGTAYGDGSLMLDTEVELTANDYIEIGTIVDDTDAVYIVNSIVGDTEVIMRRIG